MISRAITSILTAMCLWAPAKAQVPDNVVRTAIIHGWRDEDGRHVAGLEIRLAPGWKTYWRAPGDGGIPPSFDWTGSSNMRSISVSYPVPEVFHLNGVRSIGYDGGVVFPLVIDVHEKGAPIQLVGVVDLGVCEEVCLPVQVRISAVLQPSKAASATLAEALKDRPDKGGELTCRIEPIADGLRLEIETTLPQMDGEETVIVEASERGLWISQADVSRDGTTLVAEVEMVPPDAKPFALSRSGVRMTVLANGDAVESTGCR